MTLDHDNERDAAPMLTGDSLHTLRKIVALTVAIAVSDCQTLDGVTLNGVSLAATGTQVEEAQGRSYCQRNFVLCTAGVVFGSVLAISLLAYTLSAEN